MHAIGTTLDIPICKSIEDIQVTTSQDAGLQRPKSYLIQGWPHTKDKVEHSIQNYWLIKHEEVMIDGNAMKDKQKIIPFSFQNQTQEQLHSNHMGTEKIRHQVR